MFVYNLVQHGIEHWSSEFGLCVLGLVQIILYLLSWTQ